MNPGLLPLMPLTTFPWISTIPQQPGKDGPQFPKTFQDNNNATKNDKKQDDNATNKKTKVKLKSFNIDEILKDK